MTQLERQTIAAPTGGLRFPADFVWGAATASYQIEGAVDVDGRSPSIWDTFCRIPGAVVDGDTGDIACDHYRRMPEDVALMKELGLGSYRFSVAWPRVCPGGGPVNQTGLDFYRRLVDQLQAADIRPWLTLYHWDLPQALEDAGGWTNRDTAHRFVDYAIAVHDALGDGVPTITTLNEPWCSAFLGYTAGQHAPGRQEGAAGLVAAHHLLLGHGLAVSALRDQGTRAELGLTLNFTVADPHDPTDPVDRDAARRIDGLHNRFFLDPLLRGRYPADVLEDTAGLEFAGRPWSEVVRDGDLDLIGTPIDVLGVNYYHGDAVSGRPHPKPVDEVRHPERDVVKPYPGSEHVTPVRRDLPVTGLGWEVQPEGLTRLLVRLRDDYAPPPMYITENGAAYPDALVDGIVDDPGRRGYVEAHLRALHAALAAGVDVRGFFQWSLLDNFEWAYGYGQRFGIVYVDYATQQRVPKTSALYYSEVATTGVVPDATEEGWPE
ncbi:MAG TPA: GH1 family beta-glucosidase [Nocardioidaceae bacterium]|nr:GH1 family beta-glucosidase [Nocardioidaceae bacterium]